MNELDKYVLIRPVEEIYTPGGAAIVIEALSDSTETIEEWRLGINEQYDLGLEYYEPEKGKGSTKFFSILDSRDSRKWNAPWEPSGDKIKPGYDRPSLN